MKITFKSEIKQPRLIFNFYYQIKKFVDEKVNVMLFLYYIKNMTPAD